jgi:hypothetical protein
MAAAADSSTEGLFHRASGAQAPAFGAGENQTSTFASTREKSAL